MERDLNLVVAELESVMVQMKELSGKKLCLEAELADLVGSKEEGTKSLSCSDFRVSTVAKINRSLVKGTTWDDIAGAVGPDAAATLFKWQPQLVLSEYRQMDEESRKRLSHLLVAKPAKLVVKIDREAE